MLPQQRHFAKCKWNILPDFAGLYGFITFAVLFIFAHRKVFNDGDSFWHIAAGQHMLANMQILKQDVFSHTAYGTPWTAHEWLSEVIMAWLHNHTGLMGVAIFFFLITALTFWLLFHIISDVADERIALFSVSLGLTFSMPHMLARPHVFSWLFGVTTLYALHKKGHWYWLLPPLTTLWANLHGGFILGLALQTLVIGGAVLEHVLSKSPRNMLTLWQQVKRPFLFLLASILAAAINPFGFKLFLFPFQVTSGIFSTGIQEWAAPDLQNLWPFRLFLLLILLLMSLKRIPTTWTDRLFVLFFINASLTHQRYIGLAAVFLCPYFSKMLKTLPWPSKRLNTNRPEPKQIPTSLSSGPMLTIILAIILACFSAPSHPKAQSILETFLPIPSDNHPINAVAYLNQNRPSGKMFNKYSWGGYLIYALEPAQKVFIDGRADMYGEEIFNNYDKIASLDKEAEELLNQYRIEWIVFPKNSVLIRYLKATNKWQETYSDEIASILVRRIERLP